MGQLVFGVWGCMFAEVQGDSTSSVTQTWGLTPRQTEQAWGFPQVLGPK